MRVYCGSYGWMMNGDVELILEKMGEKWHGVA